MFLLSSLSTVEFRNTPVGYLQKAALDNMLRRHVKFSPRSAIERSRQIESLFPEPTAQKVEKNLMSTETISWRQVREVFHACLDLPESERAAFVAEACGADLDLLAEVQSLLDFHEDPETLVDLGASEPMPAAVEKELDRYRLIEVLGRGGMGVVYRARRADGAYEEEVAIKLVHSHLVANDLVRRFRQERQILADLKHPAIARLLDGGTATDGRPFLVMEFVDGSRIDHYCDQHRLTLRQRAELFVEVCRAVHFAHQNLVVHRDLKPGNLMVDGDGRPKLLDFGIAKLIDPSAPELTRAYGEDRGSPLTPDFASPEQITGRPVTTASDIYALGGLLYVLLTGRRPLPTNDLSLGELVETVARKEPPAPSVRVIAEDLSDEDRRQAAEARGCIDSARLSRELTGDLDRVVAVAMAKEPSRRYASAEALADDLNRYIHGHAVLARDQTVIYRLGKFLRRHRWPSLLAISSLLALIALTTVLLIQRDHLLKEKALSSEVIRFMEGLFEVSTPESARGRPVLARELLDEGALNIRHRFAEQPQLRARLDGTMGRAYLSLGYLESAEPLLTHSAEIRSKLYSEDHPEYLDGRIDLGELRLDQGRIDEAESLFEQVEHHLKGSSDLADQKLKALLGLSGVRLLQSDFEEALSLRLAAKELATRAFPSDPERIARIHYGIGEAHRLQGDFAAAREAYDAARRIQQEVSGELHPDVAKLHLQMGILLEEEGRLEEAEIALRRAADIQAEIYPEHHPLLAEPWNNLASVLLAQGRADEAETLCRQGLRQRRDTLYPDHYSIGESLNLLGLIMRQQKRHEEAEAAFREARELWLRELGANAVPVAAVTNNIGRALTDRGLLPEAEKEYLDALRIYRAALGEDHLQVATVLNNLGFNRKRAQDRSGARNAYDQALGILKTVYGPKHPKTAIAANNLANLLLKDRPEEAVPLLRLALDGLTQTLPPGHLNLGLVRRNLAVGLLATGKAYEAEKTLLEALDIYAEAGEADHAMTVLSARGVLAEAYDAQSRRREALDILRHDLRLALDAYGEGSRAVERTRERLEEVEG